MMTDTPKKFASHDEAATDARARNLLRSPYDAYWVVAKDGDHWVVKEAE